MASTSVASQPNNGGVFCLATPVPGPWLPQQPSLAAELPPPPPLLRAPCPALTTNRDQPASGNIPSPSSAATEAVVECGRCLAARGYPRSPSAPSPPAPPAARSTATIAATVDTSAAGGARPGTSAVPTWSAAIRPGPPQRCRKAHRRAALLPRRLRRRPPPPPRRRRRLWSRRRGGWRRRHQWSRGMAEG